MVHHRLGQRQVPREVVRKMRQNGWSVKPEPKPAPKKETATKESD